MKLEKCRDYFYRTKQNDAHHHIIAQSHPSIKISLESFRAHQSFSTTLEAASHQIIGLTIGQFLNPIQHQQNHNIYLLI